MGKTDLENHDRPERAGLLRRRWLQNGVYIRYNVVRVIAQSRGPVVPPARVPTRPDSRTRTPPAGRPYCADGRNHRLRHPPRWCGSGATPRNLPDCRSVILFWGCTCRTWGKSPDFGPRDQIVVVSEGRSDNQVDFSASLHSHTTWGGDAAGGWGRTRGLGPPAAPSGTRGGPPARAARRGHVCKL